MDVYKIMTVKKAKKKLSDSTFITRKGDTCPENMWNSVLQNTVHVKGLRAFRRQLQKMKRRKSPLETITHKDDHL